ncbi:hypothetical protein, partial [Streptomyces sp. NPDC059515]|uniref:hypothetical protein n=1 Tax=Streptomyces sp. NPDC059515 TaxID=3346854 RepID=UPI0036CE991A
MDLRKIRLPARARGGGRRRRWAAAAAAVFVLAGAGTWTAVASEDPPAEVVREDRALTTGDGVRIDTSYFTSGPEGPPPPPPRRHSIGRPHEGREINTKNQDPQDRSVN